MGFHTRRRVGLVLTVTVFLNYHLTVVSPWVGELVGVVSRGEGCVGMVGIEEMFVILVGCGENTFAVKWCCVKYV